MNKVLSAYGYTQLALLEGERLTAYRDTGGKWTIAIGVTVYPNGNAVRQGDKITKAQSTEYTENAVAIFEKAVNRLIKVPLTQMQFDALVIFVYNIGATAFVAGTVDDKLNAGNIDAAIATWAQYNKVRNAKTGKLEVDKGIVNRRAAEIKIFKS